MKTGKILTVVMLLLFAGLNLPAQENVSKKKCSCLFESLNQLGLLEGESKGAFQVQTINGIRFKTWFVGLGAGLDNYGFRSIPVFVDVRKNFSDRNKTPFVYGEAGIHFIWEDAEIKNNYYNSDFSNGLYYGIGLGYRLGLKNNDAFVFTVGYSFKGLSESRQGIIFCVTAPCPEMPVEEFKYKFRRISMQLGFSF